MIFQDNSDKLFVHVRYFFFLLGGLKNMWFLWTFLYFFLLLGVCDTIDPTYENARVTTGHLNIPESR